MSQDRIGSNILPLTQDRIGSNILPLTQDFLAQMLGTRRASVSVAASILQRAGLIHYARGFVSIVNRQGLEEACCECHLLYWKLRAAHRSKRDALVRCPFSGKED
jgi:hypothetical protein